MVWANGLGDALDEAVDWAADHAPGFLADEFVAESYREALDECRAECVECSSASEPCESCESHARDQSEVDTTCAGNEGHYIMSNDWHIVAEDPSRAEIEAMVRR